MLKHSPVALWLLLSSFSLSAAGGFGDLLKKLEEQVPDVLQPQTSDGGTTLDTNTLAAGLKEALRVGSERAVTQVSAADGFLANPNIRIPLPATVEQASQVLRRFGMGGLVDELELSMNRAAEQAAPAAAQHLTSAVQAMSFEDAKRIFDGPEDAATRYFENSTRSQIGADFKPLIQDAMNQVGVTRYYQQLVSEASRYPLVGDLNLDLESHVTDAALSGLFSVLAEQEALIRTDPVARSTDLLKQVFGQ